MVLDACEININACLIFMGILMKINFSDTAAKIFYSCFPIIFAISYLQRPLYTSNQNTYFLHGLAKTGSGFLKSDWLANTVDPFPVFSELVYLTTITFGENFFYVIYLFILGVFAYSLLGIAALIFGIRKTALQYWILFICIVVLNSGLAAKLHEIFSPDGVLASGVAGQYILGQVFQPSTFGVFIVLSIYLFLLEKPFFSVICLAIAASFHSTYLLSAALLTIAYVFILYTKKLNHKNIVYLGLLSFVLVLPVLIYNIINFSPTSAEFTHQAQDILVNHRISHHAKITSWFDKWTAFQILLIAIAIYLVRKTDVFLILLIPFVAAFGLALIQFATNNYGLALIFPWRVSVFLVPLSTTIIIASIILFAFKMFEQGILKNKFKLEMICVFLVLFVGFLGVRQTVTLINTPKAGVNALSRFIGDISKNNQVFLVPSDLDTIRLAARVSIFVDYKSHPYKDIELLEWFDRINLNKSLYDPKNIDIACNAIENISRKFNITHVVWKTNLAIKNCNPLKQIYEDQNYIVYELSS